MKVPYDQPLQETRNVIIYIRKNIALKGKCGLPTIFFPFSIFSVFF
jgi:hypothetical protein